MTNKRCHKIQPASSRLGNQPALQIGQTNDGDEDPSHPKKYLPAPGQGERFTIHEIPFQRLKPL